MRYPIWFTEVIHRSSPHD